jgi:hypothetical protein
MEVCICLEWMEKVPLEPGLSAEAKAIAGKMARTPSPPLTKPINQLAEARGKDWAKDKEWVRADVAVEGKAADAAKATAKQPEEATFFHTNPHHRLPETAAGFFREAL